MGQANHVDISTGNTRSYIKAWGLTQMSYANIDHTQVACEIGPTAIRTGNYVTRFRNSATLLMVRLKWPGPLRLIETNRIRLIMHPIKSTNVVIMHIH